MVGTIRIGTEVRVGVDSAPASSREGEEGRWRARRLETGMGLVLTGLAQRFVDEPRERLGFFGVSASALLGWAERLRCTGWVVGQPNMGEETNQYERD
jgi:hypothetical protein